MRYTMQKHRNTQGMYAWYILLCVFHWQIFSVRCNYYGKYNILFALQAIKDFDEFLRRWQTQWKKPKERFSVSPSTVNGFKITLGSTLELLQYLHEEKNFEYLMTTRLNQDALEVRCFRTIPSVNRYTLPLKSLNTLVEICSRTKSQIVESTKKIAQFPKQLLKGDKFGVVMLFFLENSVRFRYHFFP